MTCPIKLKLFIGTVLLALVVSNANAADNYIVIKRTATNLSDTTDRLLVSFTLPATVNTSSLTANSAVLQFVATQSEFNFNEVYINPTVEDCFDNNQDASTGIGFITPHKDINAKVEIYTNQIAFSSATLKAGTNKVMVCIRDIDGNSPPTGNNIDNVTINHIVLHYKTTD